MSSRNIIEWLSSAFFSDLILLSPAPRGAFQLHGLGFCVEFCMFGCAIINNRDIYVIRNTKFLLPDTNTKYWNFHPTNHLEVKSNIFSWLIDIFQSIKSCIISLMTKSTYTVIDVFPCDVSNLHWNNTMAFPSLMKALNFRNYVKFGLCIRLNLEILIILYYLE